MPQNGNTLNYNIITGESQQRTITIKFVPLRKYEFALHAQ